MSKRQHKHICKNEKLRLVCANNVGGNVGFIINRKHFEISKSSNQGKMEFYSIPNLSIFAITMISILLFETN